jgi:hypothetical protein
MVPKVLRVEQELEQGFSARKRKLFMDLHSFKPWLQIHLGQIVTKKPISIGFPVWSSCVNHLQLNFKTY